MKPGVEPVGIAQPGEIAPCPHERFLDCVAGEFVVARDKASCSVEADDRAAGEFREGVVIASASLLHERSIVHVRLAYGTASWSCAQPTASPSGESFPSRPTAWPSVAENAFEYRNRGRADRAEWLVDRVDPVYFQIRSDATGQH